MKWCCIGTPNPAVGCDCDKGFAALKKWIETTSIFLAAPVAKLLRDALRTGGIVPELRAERLRQIAARVETEFDGDLDLVLKLPVAGSARPTGNFQRLAKLAPRKFCYLRERRPQRQYRQIAFTCRCVWDLEMKVRIGRRRTSQRRRFESNCRKPVRRSCGRILYLRNMGRRFARVRGRIARTVPSQMSVNILQEQRDEQAVRQIAKVQQPFLRGPLSGQRFP